MVNLKAAGRLTDMDRKRQIEANDRPPQRQGLRRKADSDLKGSETLPVEEVLGEEACGIESRKNTVKLRQEIKQACDWGEEIATRGYHSNDTDDAGFEKRGVQTRSVGTIAQLWWWSRMAWMFLKEQAADGIRAKPHVPGRVIVPAVFFLLTIGWLQGALGQVQSTSNRAEYSPMFGGGVARTGIYPGSGPKEKPVVEWRFETGDGFDTSPAVANGVAYVGSNDGNLYAVDARTGNEQWRFETKFVVRSSPAVAGGTVYFGGGDGNLYAVDAQTGEEQWSFKTGGAVYSSPAVIGSTVYVGSNDGNLYAVDAQTGEEQWSFKTGEPVRSSPAVSGETVYVGSNDGTLHAVDAETGHDRWGFETKNRVQSSAAVVDGIVYVGSNDGNLYAVDAQTGNGQWSLETGTQVTSSPTVVNGVLYVGTTGLIALQGDRPERGPTTVSASSSDETSSKPNGAPSEELLRAAIVASLEKGEVPRAVRGASMITSCGDGNVVNLTIRAVGRKQERDGKAYWPVKALVTGSCTEDVNCGPDNIMGECDTITFKKAKAEFRVWKDPYGDWQAKVVRR